MSSGAWSRTHFSFRVEMKDQPLTRLGILSTVSSVFDPLGMLVPLILLGKSILHSYVAMEHIETTRYQTHYGQDGNAGEVTCTCFQGLRFSGGTDPET